ncbi:MAG: 2-hydroxy-3-oxopropionate reductase [Microbacteriaceae bacterium]|nr:2-hydroxy-3-oxopropionate reductase [Microbacteriaceae bacterium]
MTTVAFIGLGIMGRPMAINLMRAGFDVVGFNRSRQSIDALVAKGGRAASSVVDAVKDADIIATMLPDTPDVVEILAGENGVFANARPGALIIDFSTIKADASARLAEQGTGGDFRVLDAPVSGGEQGAIEGTLSIMVGGEPDDFDDAKAVFDAVGKTVVHVGPAGSGQIVKAANQLIVAGTLGLVAEAITFLEAYGVKTEPAITVLGGGLAGSTVLSRKAPNMINRTFTPGFRVELHDKDMGIVTEAARQAGVAIPLGSLAAELLGSLKAQGHGGLDHSAIFLVLEQLSGRAGDDIPNTDH